MNYTQILIVLALFCNGLLAQAAEINVSNGSSIQAAIDSASNGDELILESGTYTGDISLSGKDITINGAGFSTVIQGSGNGSVIRCDSGSPVITGVSITGGSATNGGGIYVLNTCSLTVNNSAIYNNSASGTGSAICVRGTGESSFSNNVVAFNTKTGSAEPHSIYVTDGNANFIRNTISHNASPGNAIFVTGSSSKSRITRNIISNNGEGGIGRGICVVGGAKLGRKVRIQRNIFFENSASELFFNGKDFTGGKGIRRLQRRISSRRFSKNRHFDPQYVNIGEDFSSSDFNTQEERASNNGAFSSGS